MCLRRLFKWELGERCFHFGFAVDLLRNRQSLRDVFVNHRLQLAANWLLDEAGARVEIADGVAVDDDHLPALVVLGDRHRKCEGQEQAENGHAGVAESLFFRFAFVHGPNNVY